MKEKKFNVRLGNLELRSCGKDLITSDNVEHETAEIVAWGDGDKSCHTVAYFKRSGDNFNLVFVGARPLNVKVKWHNFKSLIELGYNLLTKTVA